MTVSLSRLERQLGYTFKDQELMVLALTHRSFAGRNNERLEFLGDAILNFAAGEALLDIQTRRLRVSEPRIASAAPAAACAGRISRPWRGSAGPAASACIETVRGMGYRLVPP